jgi:hypothetical protein
MTAAWACVRGDLEEPAMARAKRKKSPNADLVEAVQNHVDQILLFYEGVEDEQPILVLDYQNQKICAYHYEEYKTRLSPESQATLDEEYEKAMAEDKVVVLVWDSATGRLVTTTFDYN